MIDNFDAMTGFTSLEYDKVSSLDASDDSRRVRRQKKRIYLWRTELTHNSIYEKYDGLNSLFNQVSSWLRILTIRSSKLINVFDKQATEF